MTRVPRRLKLLTLVLSFESGTFKKIQDVGQNETFVLQTSDRSEIVRYVGKPTAPTKGHRTLFLFRRFQYALLDFSNNWFIGFIVEQLAKWRLGDRLTRSIRENPSASMASLSLNHDEKIKSPPTIITNTPEDWSLIGLKTLLAFKFVLENYNFDYLFRTNTSSYVDTDLLIDTLSNFPKRNVYGGVIGKAFNDKEFASGAGILLSRDLVERICANADNWKHGLVDDVALADLIFGFNDPNINLIPLGRLDVPNIQHAKSLPVQEIRRHFHFRCKTNSPEETIEIMRYLFKIKTGNTKD